LKILIFVFELIPINVELPLWTYMQLWLEEKATQRKGEEAYNQKLDRLAPGRLLAASEAD